MEKHERLQALASAKTPVLSFAATGERSGGSVTRGAAPTVLNKDIRGPWDGLGINRRDIGSHEEQQSDQTKAQRSQDASSLINTRKRLAPNSVQTVVSRRLKIVDVKPDNVSHKISATAVSVKEGEGTGTSQWEGLVGYGSEDSDDD